MLKTLMVTTAATALTIGAATAQGTEPPAPASPPAASPSTPAPAPKSSEMSKPAPSDKSAKFIGSQQSDQYLASNFKGTDVIGADNKKIGDVNDILFDKDGKVLAYVVGVGGFLGLGSKDVALEPSAFQVVAGDKSKNESDRLRLSMTQDQLKQAANFEPYKAPSSTTGMGSSSPARPSPGGIVR
ncbi:MAG: PRC-barrel domain-containing protein [Xanthobacteraceae bacterium]